MVVDDGSRDGTTAVAERHARHDRRVRVIRQKNGGVAAARNNGISETRGRYIAPLDADDLWLPQKIERQLETLRRDPGRIGLVYSWFVLIDSDNRILAEENRHSDEGNVIASLCLRYIVG